MMYQPCQPTGSPQSHSSSDRSWKTLVLPMTMEFFVLLKNLTVAILTSVFRFFVTPPKKSVEGEIMLITGSARGIGRQLAVDFSKLGAVLVLWDIDEKGICETAKMITEEGGVCFPYICDVGNREEVYQVASVVKRDVGTVSVLVNNAGVVTGKKLLECPDELIERTIKVNLMAHFWTTKCFLPGMLKKNHGHVVNMASSTGLNGLNKLTDYSASKYGVIGFTEVLNYEILFSGYTGVHTTVVCPAMVKTGMFEGCKLRFPWLFPQLSPEETSQRIMEAVLTDQYIICLPRLVYFFPVWKSMLPVEAMLEILHYFGADKFMDSFKGKPLQDSHIQNGCHENGFHPSS